MAETTTYSVKMADEQKKDLQSRVDASGLQAGEYLQMLVNSFDATQHRETLIDDAEVKLLESHISRISEIYLSMAKNRADEKIIAQESQAELQDTIKSLKSELLDLRETTKLQLIELRANTDIEIELANEKVILAEQNESKALDDMNKAEQNELQVKRAFSKLEDYNENLKQQIADAKQDVAIANQKVIEAQEQIKAMQDSIKHNKTQHESMISAMREALSNEQSLLTAAQAKIESLGKELAQSNINFNKLQIQNQNLLNKLDDAMEIKNQALGELKAIHSSSKGLQETIAGQNKIIDELKLEIWKYKMQVNNKEE